jgi:hypothetical protein
VKKEIKDLQRVQENGTLLDLPRVFHSTGERNGSRIEEE